MASGISVTAIQVFQKSSSFQSIVLGGIGEQ